MTVLRGALESGTQGPKDELLRDVEIADAKPRRVVRLGHCPVSSHHRRHGCVVSISPASASSQLSSASQRSTSRAR